MYAGTIPLLVGMSLWLESYAAAVLAVIPVSTLVLRIRIEEEFLRRELKGYEEYTKRVRYRLIPFLWYSPHQKPYSMISGTMWTTGGPKMSTVTMEVSSREKINQRFLRAIEGEPQGAF